MLHFIKGKCFVKCIHITDAISKFRKNAFFIKKHILRYSIISKILINDMLVMHKKQDRHDDVNDCFTIRLMYLAFDVQNKVL